MLSQVDCDRKLIKKDHGFPQPNVNKLNTFVWQESSSSACSQVYEKKIQTEILLAVKDYLNASECNSNDCISMVLHEKLIKY